MNKVGKNAKKKRRARNLKVNFRVRYQFRYNEDREGYQKSWGALKKGLSNRKRKKFGGFVSNIFQLSNPLLIEDSVSTPSHSPQNPQPDHQGDMPYLRIMQMYFGFSHIFQQCDPITATNQQYRIAW